MVPSEKTLQALITAERELRNIKDEQYNPHLMTLYGYYCIADGKGITREEIKEATGLSLNDIRRDNKALGKMKLLVIRAGNNRKTIFDIQDKFTPLNPNTVSLLFSIYKDHIRKGEERTDDVQVQAGDFSESDIRNDEDWKKAEPVLLKYFKPHQINPRHLTRKKRFEALCELLSDSTFDFDAFCKWYRVEKYPLKKFNYGLFLCSDMIAEFRDVVEDDKDDIYLKTSSRLEDSESFKKSLAETNEFLKKIQEKEDNK